MLRSASAGWTRPGPPTWSWRPPQLSPRFLRSWLAHARIACPVPAESGELRAGQGRLWKCRVEALLLLAELPSGIPPLRRQGIQVWNERGPDLTKSADSLGARPVVHPISHLRPSGDRTIESLSQSTTHKNRRCTMQPTVISFGISVLVASLCSSYDILQLRTIECLTIADLQVIGSRVCCRDVQLAVMRADAGENDGLRPLLRNRSQRLPAGSCHTGTRELLALDDGAVLETLRRSETSEKAPGSACHSALQETSSLELCRSLLWPPKKLQSCTDRSCRRSRGVSNSTPSCRCHSA